MKIAFILSKFPSLSETFILDQIIGLVKNGIDVDIFAEYNPKEKKTHDNIIKHKLIQKVRYYKPVKNSSKILLLVRIIASNVILNFTPTMAVFKVVIFNILKTRGGNFSKIIETTWDNLKMFYLLNTNLARKKYDVMHYHFGPNGMLGALLKIIGVKSRIVTTFYGYDLSSFLVGKPITIYSTLFKKGDLFLPICKAFKDKLISLGCSESKIQIHPLGVNMDFFNVPERLLKNQSIQILSIGRLVEKKGMQYSVKAMAKLVPKFPNLKLNIIGDGPLYKYLNNLIIKLKLTSNVRLVGSIDRNEVQDHLSKSDIFVLHSITSKNGDTEGTPTALLEAQAMMLPVISTIHAGIPEIVENNVTGILIPEKDVDKLSEAIENLVENGKTRVKMGIAAREKVAKDFDVQKLNQKLIVIYSSMMKSNIT